MVDRALLNYVEQVYFLERDQYTLQQMIIKLRGELVRKKGQIQSEKAVNSYLPKVDYSYAEVELCPTSAKVKIGFGIFWIFMVLMLIGQINTYEGGPNEPGTFYAAMLFHIAIGAILIVSGFKTMTTREEENARRKYEAERKAEQQIEEIRRNNEKIRQNNI